MFQILYDRLTGRSVCLALLLLGVHAIITVSVVGQTATTPAWTLPEALSIAFAHSPALRAQHSALGETRAGLVGAKTYPHNPEIVLELVDRDSPGSSTVDRSVSLSQEIELAGQRRKRIAVADAELAAAEAAFLHQRCLLALQVESVFGEAIRTRELLAVAETDAALARDMLDFSTRRLARGAGTQIEVNLAHASSGRAERRVQQARAAYTEARSRLAEVVGRDPAAPPEPLGDLPIAEDESLSLSELLARAKEQRADLRSLGLVGQAAEAEIRLALAEGRPRLTVGAFVGREERTEDLLGISLGVSVPLFERNQGRIAAARAARERLIQERAAMALTIERQVTTAFARLQGARAAARQLQDQVVGSLEENVDLLQRSFAAGRIGATDVVTLRREFVASRSEYLEALADIWLGRLDLHRATGCTAPPEIRLEKEPS